MTGLGFTEVMLYAKIYASFEDASEANQNMEIVSFSA